MQCKTCIKSDVCNQKDIYQAVLNASNGLVALITYADDSSVSSTQCDIAEIRRKYGITVEVVCKKYSPAKHTGSDGW